MTVAINYGTGTVVGGAVVGAAVGANHALTALTVTQGGHVLLVAGATSDVAATAAVGASLGAAAGVALGLAFAGGYLVGTLAYNSFTNWYYGG